MKNANEFVFDCASFKKCIMSYIDDELPVNHVSPFLAHADKCPFCGKELEELLFLKKSLSGMRRMTVSPDFSFRVGNALRNEQKRLQNPLYKFRLYFAENYQKFVLVPAVVLALAGWMLFNDSGLKTQIALPFKNVIAQISGKEISRQETELGVERVNYILESVTPGDVEEGIITEHSGGTKGSVANAQLTLVNF